MSDGALSSPSVFATVVVTAFGRREFLGQAVRSVRCQTLPSREIELLLVTDLADPDLGEPDPEESVRVLRPKSTRMGEWVAEAAREARGEVLFLLDDDDLFFPGKLERIRAAFRADPRIGYYRHGLRTFWGEDGPRDFGPEPAGDFEDHKRWVTAGPRSDARALARAWWAEGAGVPSAIGVRREVVTRFEDRLRRIQIGVGPLLFYAAALDGWRLVVDPARLGGRRLHSHNTSGAGSEDAGTRWARQLAVADRALRDASEVRQLLRDSTTAREFGAPLEAMVARVGLLRAAVSSEPTRVEVLRRILAVVRTTGLGQLASAAPYVGMGGLRSLSARPVRRLLGPDTAG